MRTKGLAFLACTVLLAPIASAQTGNDLYKLCSSENVHEKMACDLYISGFLHGL